MLQRVSRIIEIVKSAFENAENNREHVIQSIKECSKQLIILRSILRYATNVGVKQSATSGIGLIQGYRTKLKVLNSTARSRWASIRIRWEEIESAFSGR